MNPLYLIMVIYLSLILVALLNNKPYSAVFVFVCGMAILALYRYGGEKTRTYLKKIF